MGLFSGKEEKKSKAEKVIEICKKLESARAAVRDAISRKEYYEKRSQEAELVLKENRDEVHKNVLELADATTKLDWLYEELNAILNSKGE